MAIIDVNFFSKSLMRSVRFKAIIPADKLVPGQDMSDAVEKYKTLYLLHGIYGNEEDWITNTRILRWSQMRNLAVIMPAGENKFYSDNQNELDYYMKYLCEELVEFTRKVFPLSEKKEDTFIAGLSMGGYGALVNGLTYHKTFGYIGGLSSAFIIEGMLTDGESKNDGLPERPFYESVFGNVENYKGSNRDYEYLIRHLKEEDVKLPDIFLAVGTEDFLLEQNRKYKTYLEEQEVKFTYEEGPGGHDWEFWDTFIKKFLDWLPLGKEVEGVGSGNVK